MESRSIVMLLLSMLLLVVVRVRGHGRLVDPPSRASMWRYGFDNPKNYDDTALYCGGFSAQWETNGGRCGVCGDRYDGPRQHEAGGKYANGIIVRHFRQGQTIQVRVELTTSHLGWFEFRLCPQNNPRLPVTQRCLDRYLLRQPDGSTRYPIRSFRQGVRTVRLVLPPGVTCSQCVLQWKYNAGNSWGCEGAGRSKRCCNGCGRQEQFYACADVDITSGGNGNNNNNNNNNAPYPPQATNTNTNNNNNNNANYGTGYHSNQHPGSASGLQGNQASPHQYTRQPPGSLVPGGSSSSSLGGSQPSISSPCRGIVPTFTTYCIRTCGTSGFCPRIYCTEGCRRLKTGIPR